ncbi:MAG: hypothetical protein ACKO7W_15810 [Elainella sp.]
MRPTRVKSCAQCQQTTAVLFRVSPEPEKGWVFVCAACLPQLKHNNPDYRYGGTWKAQKLRK